MTLDQVDAAREAIQTAIEQAKEWTGVLSGGVELVARWERLLVELGGIGGK